MRASNTEAWGCSWLTPRERKVLLSWYATTERDRMVGEMSIAAMSVILGIVGGSEVTRVVQLGTYAGWSSLLMGWCLQRTGGKLWTTDINECYANYADAWIREARLDNIVESAAINSQSPEAFEAARQWLGGPPQVVVIDSSHEYMQTRAEIIDWGIELEEGGLIILHDASDLAREYDTTGENGVKRAVEELRRDMRVECIILNTEGLSNVFKDPCGLAIIQKPTIAGGRIP